MENNESNASPAAAPAAGQEGLAKLAVYEFSAFEDGKRQQYALLSDVKALFAPVAAATEQATDWISVWDAAPVQGEGVLVTDGETVTAARWFSTGWAEHGFDSDEVEYLPEGRVTHWKSLPPAPTAEQATDNDLLDVMDPPRAALKAEDWDAATRKPKVKPAAPLATSADAGAGQAPARLIEAGALRQYQHNDGSGLVFAYDKAIVDREFARLSTPGAQVTASDWPHAPHLENAASAPAPVTATGDLRKSVQQITALLKEREWADLLDMSDPDAFALWSAVDALVATNNEARGAPVTAEPVASIHENEEVRQAVAEGLRGLWGCGRVWSAWNVGTMGEDDFYAADESDECIDQMIHAIAFLIAPAPADRDAIREAAFTAGWNDAMVTVRAEIGSLQDNLETFGQNSEETARIVLDGVLDAIDELKSMERAADAKGEQQ